MPSPAALKGIKQIVDKVNDEVLEAAGKLTQKAVKAGGRLEISGAVEIDGDYEFDKDGHVRFSGKVKADIPTNLPVDLRVEVGPEAGKEWHAEGQAHMRLMFGVKYQIGEQAEEAPDG